MRFVICGGQYLRGPTGGGGGVGRSAGGGGSSAGPAAACDSLGVFSSGWDSIAVSAPSWAARSAAGWSSGAFMQGLTLVHFSAQLELWPTQ